MVESAEPAICQFYRLIRGAPEPQRADRSADGTLPMIAYRYCEPVAAASGFGWYVYPPLNFSLVWDGREIAWTYEGSDGWDALRAAPYPGFLESFAKLAPDGMSGLMPTFLTQGKLPGVVQIWSGYLASTRPGWALLSRGVANLAQNQPYEIHEAIVEPELEQDNEEITPPYVNYEGIIETDTWFGPLFTNVRLMRINSPVDFHVNRPLFQVQPILRQCYREPSFTVQGSEGLTPEHWRRFEATMRPNTDHMRHPGHYAVKTRKRLRGADAAR
jgi:hypothetical protein